MRSSGRGAPGARPADGPRTRSAMEDARGFRLPPALSRRPRAGSTGPIPFPVAVAVALTARRFHDPGSPLAGAGWILDAGVTALALLWLVSRFGRRRERRGALSWG